MKFLCIGCDEVMSFAERQLPGDGTLTAVFGCATCGTEIAMLANPMETQLVSSLGVKVGGRSVPDQPMELVRGNLAEGRDDAFDDLDAGIAAGDAAEAGRGSAGAAASGEPPAGAGSADGATAGAAGRVEWSEDAVARLGRVPSFVRGMVKRIYTDYARERGIARITPEIMDRARTELGLEGM